MTTLNATTQALLDAIKGDELIHDADAIIDALGDIDAATEAQREALTLIERVSVRFPENARDMFQLTAAQLVALADSAKTPRVILLIARIMIRHPALRHPVWSRLYKHDERIQQVLDALRRAPQTPLITLGLNALLMRRGVQAERDIAELAAMAQQLDEALPNTIALDLLDALLLRDEPLASQQNPALAEAELALLSALWPILHVAQRVSALGTFEAKFVAAFKKKTPGPFAGIMQQRQRVPMLLLNDHVETDLERALALKVLLLAQLPFPEIHAIRLLTSDNEDLRRVATNAISRGVSPHAGDALITLYPRLSKVEQVVVAQALRGIGRDPHEPPKHHMAGALTSVEDGRQGGLEVVEAESGAIELIYNPDAPAPSDAALVAFSGASMTKGLRAEDKPWLSLAPAPRNIPTSIKLQNYIIGTSLPHRLALLANNAFMLLIFHVILIEMTNNEAVCALTMFLLIYGPTVAVVVWPLISFVNSLFFISPRQLRDATVITRRVHKAERTLWGIRVEIEDELGPQRLTLPVSQAADLEAGMMLPVFVSPRGGAMHSPLELRAVGVDPSGQLTLRADSYTKAVSALALLSIVAIILQKLYLLSL